jgi:hypothetical protein
MNAMCVITRLKSLSIKDGDNQYQHVLNSCADESKTPEHLN